MLTLNVASMVRHGPLLYTCAVMCAPTTPGVRWRTAPNSVTGFASGRSITVGAGLSTRAGPGAPVTHADATRSAVPASAGRQPIGSRIAPPHVDYCIQIANP